MTPKVPSRETTKTGFIRFPAEHRQAKGAIFPGLGMFTKQATKQDGFKPKSQDQTTCLGNEP